MALYFGCTNGVAFAKFGYDFGCVEGVTIVKIWMRRCMHKGRHGREFFDTVLDVLRASLSRNYGCDFGSTKASPSGRFRFDC